MPKSFFGKLFSNSSQLDELIRNGDEANSKRDWPRACALYRQALDIDGRRHEIWTQYGHALKECHDLDGAIEAYQTSISLRPDMADTHLQIGHAYKLAGLRDAAIASYSRALHIDADLTAAADEILRLDRVKFAYDDGETMAEHTEAREIEATLLPREGSMVDDDVRLIETAFDARHYSSQMIGVDYSGMTPAEHYLYKGWRDGLDPSPDFSTRGYLELNPDVLAADINPFVHYLRMGQQEGRLSRRRLVSSPAADGLSEWRDYAEVAQHAQRSLESSEPALDEISFAIFFSGVDPLVALSSIRLVNAPAAPRVSIIIPCLDHELLTAECIASISAAMPKNFDVEIIIADNASKGKFYEAAAKHPGLRVVRFPSNIGFGNACNEAASVAKGEYLFFLNNDAQVAPGCLEKLVDVFEGEQDATVIGIVGPKLLSFDGTLQEAGCLLQSDGVGNLLGFGRSPHVPRFNYRRRVDHVSGAALMIRKKLFDSLGGFDPIYAPAYCEDADLSLKVRSRGLDIVYEPTAVVAHHLSKTSGSTSMSPDGTEVQSKRQRISHNRNTLVSRWRTKLEARDLRTIAFYLPQYHPIPENDLWWGKGFTEWNNVAKAKPNYVGHLQPRLPADLGYYDLRLPEVMNDQAALARRYGITGFCYYYYWFDGARLLERPLERLLESGRPDFPFCLCWANENWTRRWDGRSQDVLMHQTYSDENAVAVGKDLSRYFRASQYIKVNGRPLILIYRVQELPNARRTTTILRNICRSEGIGEICIAMVESFELSAKPQNPQSYGCDLTVEFPGHGMVHDEPQVVTKSNADWSGSVHDYRQVAAAFMRRIEPSFPRLRSVLSGWDTTPRHPNSSIVLEYNTPGAFQAWLEWTYRRTLEQNCGDERIVFIQAWNEWGEGCYLEPDTRTGHSYLQAVRNALEAAALGGGVFGA